MRKPENKLTKAFRKLRRLGYFARQNFWCCQSCGWAAMTPEQAKKAVFYHAQDTESLRKRGEVHLAWSGEGSEIVNILRAEGLDVEWNGEEGRRILVKVEG